jgi:hypothetical protein
MDLQSPTMKMSIYGQIKLKNQADLLYGGQQDTARFTNSSRSSDQVYEALKPSVLDSIHGQSVLSKKQSTVHSAEEETTLLQDRISDLRKMTKIPSKFAKESY